MVEKTLPLSCEDPQSQLALCTGWLADRRVIAREVIDRTILFEVLVQPIERPRTLKLWLRLWLKTIRAFSLTATLTPCLAVGALSLLNGIPVSLAIGLSALVGIFFLQASINVFNDVEDYRRLIDLPGTLGGSGVIQSGCWTPAQLKKIATFFLFFGAAFGFPAVVREPRVLLPIGVLAALGVLFYSGKEWGFKYLALGDLVVWILCGPGLTVGFSLAITGSWSPGALWLGIFFGFLAAALLHVNNLQDMKLDRKRGVDTLAIRLGFKGSLQFLILIYIGAIASLLLAVVVRQLPPITLLGSLSTAVICAPWLFELYGASGPESSALTHCRIKAAQVHLLSGLSLIFGIFLVWMIG